MAQTKDGELDIPLYEVAVDWDAFSRLPPRDKESFVDIVQKMEHAEWFSPTGRPQKEWACIDLANYADYAEFVKDLKRNGKSYYEGTKAENRGYYTKFFNDRTFVEDLVAINTSAPERQGRPMSEMYLQTVEQMGGYPTEINNAVIPDQWVFWYRSFGTFHAEPGHRQGELVVDERLVSYLIIRRYGDFVHYGTIIGHKDYLRDGIVNKMHLDFIKAIFAARNSAIPSDNTDVSLSGIRFLSYSAYFAFPGLMQWKKSNLFKPGFFLLNVDPALQEQNLKE